MNTGIYISDINGNEVEVTDLEIALGDAKDAVLWNESKIKNHETNPEEIIFPDALKYWKHILSQLEEVQRKVNAIVNKAEKLVEETSPIYTNQSNWLFRTDRGAKEIRVFGNW